MAAGATGDETALCTNAAGQWHQYCGRTGRVIGSGDGFPAGFQGERFDIATGLGSIPLAADLRPYSPGWRGRYLGGPSGKIWDLKSGLPLRDGPFQYGVTVGYPGGFVSVDWESGAGFDIPIDGARPKPVVLRLEPDDVLEAGEFTGTHVVITTTFGQRFQVPVNSSSSREESHVYARVTPDDSMKGFGVECWIQGPSHRFGWSDSGLLVAVPS